MSNTKTDYEDKDVSGIGRQKIPVSDISGKRNDIIFEINWNSVSSKNRLLRITMGDKTAVVTKDNLWSILFMLGNADEQDKLVSPFVKQTKVQKFFKMIGITAMKDVKKGEMLTVPIEFTLNPMSGQVIIGKGNINALRKSVIR